MESIRLIGLFATALIITGIICLVGTKYGYKSEEHTNTLYSKLLDKVYADNPEYCNEILFKTEEFHKLKELGYE